MQRFLPICLFVIGPTLFNATANADLLVSYDFDGYDASLSGGETATVVNGGSTGAAGEGMVAAFQNGTVTPTSGPAGLGDAAIELNDNNTTNPTGRNGGQIAFTVPTITGDFTYAVSVRPDGPQTEFDRLLDDGAGANDVQFLSTVSVVGSRSFQDLRISLAGRHFTVQLELDAWQHLAVTYDMDGGSPGNGLVKLFVNGAEVASSNTINVSADDLSPSASTFYLGSQSNGQRPLNGALDNFMLFNHTLSDQEVADLAASTIPEPSSLAIGTLLTLSLFRRR